MKLASILLGLAGLSLAADAPPPNSTLPLATAPSNSSSPAPTECPTCSTGANSTDPELDLVARRRRADLGRWAPPAMMAAVPAWLSSQRPDGTWPDVDYRSGCDAQRANWPIQEHWNRVIALASAWAGLSPWAPEVDAAAALDAARRGVAWWFARDYTNEACIGGTPNAACPCGTPGLWNTNWFGQVILIPQLVSTACVLLQPALTGDESAGCVRIPRRAWDLRDAFIPGLNGRLTGANTLSVMQNTASLAVFTRDAGMLADALGRAMRECAFTDTPKADGIHRDGAFLQHDGILYAGNYGKDLLNAFIALEGEVTGTAFAADNATRAAVAQMLRAVEWMVFRDETGRLKWDYNTVGRFIAFPTADLQASADININTTLLAAAVADFSGPAEISATVARLQANLTSPLDGNRAFPAADYMVHRRGWTLANKMISTRSVNNELTNGANPRGYMTGQGTLFTYVTGREYTDIQAQWDWRLIPGTTTVLAPLPTRVGVNGTREFVGVVSDGELGLSAMQYASKEDGLAFNKAWFFLGDGVLVTTSNVTSNSSGAVVSVLDNRAAAPGGILLDGKPFRIGNGTRNAAARTLHYGGTGFISHGRPFALTLSEEERAGNWSAISTSKVGVQRARVFSAYTVIPETAYSYTVLPAISPAQLAREARRPRIVPLPMGAATRAALALAFFPGSERATVRAAGWDVEVFVSAPALVLITRAKRGYAVTVADPTQRLGALSVTLRAGRCGKRAAQTDTETEFESEGEGEANGVAGPNATPKHGRCCRATLQFTLPAGGHAGASVSQTACV